MDRLRVIKFYFYVPDPEETKNENLIDQTIMVESFLYTTL